MSRWLMAVGMIATIPPLRAANGAALRSGWHVLAPLARSRTARLLSCVKPAEGCLVTNSRIDQNQVIPDYGYAEDKRVDAIEDATVTG